MVISRPSALIFFCTAYFFALLGDSLLVARLPGALAGTGAIVLLFAIVQLVTKKDNYALLTATLGAVAMNMVWVSRVSIIEAILVPLILLNIYCFLKFIENKNWWWMFGGTLGLLLLTKYTSIFLVLLYITYLALEKRSYFKSKKLYGALGLTIVLLIPVIAYNVALFKSQGHFDVQLSYVTRQIVKEWPVLLGKIQSPLSAIGVTIRNIASNFLLILAGLGTVITGYWSLRKYKKEIVFLWLYIAFWTLSLIKIGSANRFLSIYGPALIILAAIPLMILWEREGRKRYLWRGIVILILLVELVITSKKTIATYPEFGIAKLDIYFTKEFDGIDTAITPESNNPHLNEVIKTFSKKKKAPKRELFIIVYNNSIALPTKQWIFYRRFLYHSTPTLTVEEYNAVQEKNGSEYFKNFTIYFVDNTNETIIEAKKESSQEATNLRKNVEEKNIAPDTIITNREGSETFRVYKFEASEV